MKEELPNQRILHRSRYASFAQLVTKCEFHPEEGVRYYCKDCFKALCAECVVNHARHDFIAANNMAANELKKQLYLTDASVSERVALYSEILDKSEKKLVDMDDDSKN
jgi:hypothetical protein